MATLTRKGWIWLYAVLVVLIITVLVLAVKSKAQAPVQDAFGNTLTPTKCCGDLIDCYGLSKSDMENLQNELNDKGCKDSNGDELKVDGKCGRLTNSAIANCR